MGHRREEKIFQMRKINARSKVLSDPWASHFPYRNLGMGAFKKCPTRPLASDTCKSAEHLRGNPWLYGMLRANFSTCLIETFVAVKCRSAIHVNLLCCYSIFIISYKIQSDLKITGPVTLTRLNLMGCPLQMNSPVNNLCLLSLMCGFS